jgi:hypothetical protein
MRPSILRTCTKTSTARPRPTPSFKMSTGVPSTTAQTQKAAQMSTNTSIPSESLLGIESTNIQTASGVELNAQQRIIVGSVLDVRTPPPPLAIERDADILRYSYSKANPPFRNSNSGPTPQNSTTPSPKRKGGNNMKRSGMDLKLRFQKSFVPLLSLPLPLPTR